jgi:hypothetical protein
MEEGKGITELKKTSKAKKEIKALIREILAKGAENGEA